MFMRAAGTPAGDMGRETAGLIRPFGGGRIGCGLLAPEPRAYWFRWDGLGFEGLAARQVRGTTPCWDRSSRIHKAYIKVSTTLTRDMWKEKTRTHPSSYSWSNRTSCPTRSSSSSSIDGLKSIRTR